jgi:serine/threonine protein kinase
VVYRILKLSVLQANYKIQAAEVSPTLEVIENLPSVPPGCIPFFCQRFEFPRDQLMLGDVIGQGSFGCVRKGVCRNVFRLGDKIDVAVKEVSTFATEHRNALLKEIKILSQLEKHFNVVSFFGACTGVTGTGALHVLMIIDLCALGSLKNFLTDNKKRFKIKRQMPKAMALQPAGFVLIS